jgi:hypothetical protein
MAVETKWMLDLEMEAQLVYGASDPALSIFYTSQTDLSRCYRRCQSTVRQHQNEDRATIPGIHRVMFLSIRRKSLE